MKLHNIQYKLTKPFTLKEYKSCLQSYKNCFLIKPHMASVCKSDLRYYTGSRPKSILDKKLPLVLLHEGIGIIQETKNKFTKGDVVIIIPQLSNKIQTPYYNYISTNKFLSSSCNGLLQRYIRLPQENILKKPEHIPERTAVMVELISVAHHAQTRVKINKNDKIAILGDGIFGHVMYYTLKTMYRNKLSIYGKNEKIRQTYDIIFECVGAKNARKAIDTALQMLNPCGHLILLGVSETGVPIKTRVIIEKGLKLIGSNRSTKNNFISAIDLLKNKKFERNINSLIKNKNITIRSIKDIKEHLDYLFKRSIKKKCILKLDI